MLLVYPNELSVIVTTAELYASKHPMITNHAHLIVTQWFCNIHVDQQSYLTGPMDQHYFLVTKLSAEHCTTVLFILENTNSLHVGQAPWIQMLVSIKDHKRMWQERFVTREICIILVLFLNCLKFSFYVVVQGDLEQKYHTPQVRPERDSNS